MSRLSHLLTILLLCSAMQLAVADRYLKQTVLDCTKSHPACTSCSVRRASANGLVSDSALVCKSCAAPAYRLFNDDATTTSTCACSPGYFADPGALATCAGCPRGAWCPGGVGAAAPKNACGNCLMTVTTLAQHVSACITQPGCGYQTDGSGSVCRIGTYSSGNNQQPCVPCPAGLTTVAARSESVAACMAPPGYFFQNMQALPCPKGSFKDSVSRATSCTPCRNGLSTAGVSSSSSTACDRAMPGYRPVRVNGSIASVEPCPIGTFGMDGLRCLNCTDGLSTQSEARTTPVDCLAAPGFGYYKSLDGLGNDSHVTPADLAAAGWPASKVIKCPNGSFKAGWSLDACTPCGTNVLTDTNASDGLGLSVDACYIPPGWGAAYTADTKQLTAFKCNNGTYGVQERTYGVEPRPCKPCPDNTVTPDMINPAEAAPGSEFHTLAISDVTTSLDQCSTVPGYGWEDSVAVPCPLGYFAHGYDNQPCVACGQGLTTQQTMSRSVTDCVALPGWEKKNPYDLFAEPCGVGSFGAGGADSCHKCPLGSSTQYTASSSVSQCGVCAPGWGLDANTSQCAICSPGSYSPGGSDGPCIRCAEQQTSATGSTSSDDCYDEFTSIAPYDFISTPVSAWTVLLVDGDANKTQNAQDCRDACRAEPACQYWLYRAGQENARDNGCSVKLAPKNHADDTYTAIKLGTGDYTIWQASDDEYEMQANSVKPWVSPDGAAANPWRCLRGCDKDPACRGVFMTKLNTTWVCWGLRGGFGLGSTASSIKAQPSAINTYYWAWAANSTGAPPKSAEGADTPTGSINGGGATTEPSNSADSPSDNTTTTSGPSTRPDEDNGTVGAVNNSSTIGANSTQPDQEPVISQDEGFIPHSGSGLNGGHSTHAPPSPPSPTPEPPASPAPAAPNSTEDVEAPASNAASNNSAPAANGAAVNTPAEPASNAASNNSAPAANGPAVSTPAEPASNNSAPAANGAAVNTPAEPASNAASNNSAPAANGPAVSTPAEPASNNSAPAANGPAVSTPAEPASNAASNNSAPAANGPAVNTPAEPASNAASNNSAPAANGAAVNTPAEPASNAASNNSAPAANGPAVNTPTEPASNAASNNSAPAANGPAVNTPAEPASNNSAPAANGPAVNTPAEPASNNSAPAANGAAVNTPAEPASNAASNNSAPAANGPAVNTRAEPASNNSAPAANGPAVSTPAEPASNAASNNSAPAANGAAVNTPAEPASNNSAPAANGPAVNTPAEPASNAASNNSAPAANGAAVNNPAEPASNAASNNSAPAANGPAVNTPTEPASNAASNNSAPAANGPAVNTPAEPASNNSAPAANGPAVNTPAEPASNNSAPAANGAAVNTPAEPASNAANNSAPVANGAAVNTPEPEAPASNAASNNSAPAAQPAFLINSPSLAQPAVCLGPFNVSLVAGAGVADAALGDGQLATSAGLNYPIGVTYHQGSLYISDTLNHRIRRVNTSSGVISTFAGTGAGVFGGDGQPAASASLNMPTAISFSPADGAAFISDTSNNRVRRVDPATSTTTTYAGDGQAEWAGDGSAATSASLYLPMQTAFDRDGNLFIAEFNSHVVRMVNASSGLVSTVAGQGGQAGFAGEGGPASKAQLNFPSSVAFDNEGRLLIADMNNHVLRRVEKDGVITTVAGTPGVSGLSGDGGLASAATLSSPADVAVDAAGNLLIADADNNSVRRVNVSAAGGPTISTIVSGLNAPQGLAVRPDGAVYVADARSQRVVLLQCAQ